MSAIPILETDANRRGDLFGRLMADLFVAFGYAEPRMNIHKSGRELDLSADHRLEPRRAIGECKATQSPIGGGDINKFVGALDAEHDPKVELSGYFISLSGFTETAIEQEKGRKRTKLILLDSAQVVRELIRGRIVIPPEKATEASGILRSSDESLVLDSMPQLVAHERGWIWIVYYSNGKVPTSCALIHADGTPLALPLAQQIIESDAACGGNLHTLNCLNRPTPLRGDIANEQLAMELYHRYVAEECGFIQLDGLPADNDVGSRRMRLENLFVPLHLKFKEESHRRISIGDALQEHPRLAILAPPGGGKSTLLKRLAVAYVDSARRDEVADRLASRDILPLFFRCRDLRDLARASFKDLLKTLSYREPVRQQQESFLAIVDRALMDGRVMLLVDGLDEISDVGDRAAFVCTLRTTLQAYPGTAIVITSREAGFRHIAAHLNSVCTRATLSPFDNSDITRLSIAWHTEVVGDTQSVRNDAGRLAHTIIANDRIKRLAVNPLLLTTLLLVKRWVGAIPTRRAVLYGKAVEVLLMTWNTEGHEPIPDEEAIPQLAYVATTMMMNGVERIGRPHLARLIQQARDALPTELGYVKGTVEDFIHRVEDRSSLLMMTGHDIDCGQLVEHFEFRHLTFQEFLAARGLVEGWHPGASDSKTLAEILRPRINDERWREVIPLAASLGGKATEPLIDMLTDLVASPIARANPELCSASTQALGNCLADEAAARPSTIRRAIRSLVQSGLNSEHRRFIGTLAKNRYGADLDDEVSRAFMEDDFTHSLAASLREVVWGQSDGMLAPKDISKTMKSIIEFLQSPNELTRCKGALWCAYLIDFVQSGRRKSLADWNDICEPLQTLLFSHSVREQYSAGWALYHLGQNRLWIPPYDPDILGRMFELWQTSDCQIVRDGMYGTLVAQQVLDRGKNLYCNTVRPESVSVLCERFDQYRDVDEAVAVIIVGWYTYAIDDDTLRRLLLQCYERHAQLYYTKTLTELASHLGVEAPPERKLLRSNKFRVPESE